MRTDSSVEAYLRDVRGTPLLTADGERELARGVARGDPQARDRFVRANLRLVVAIARGYAGRGLPLADLIGEGNLGLLRAVARFDPSRETRFANYAAYWIRQSIRRALHNTARTVRLPDRLEHLLGRWRRAQAGLRGELGRDPTEEEVALALGLSGKELDALRKALPLLHSASLQRDQGEGGLSLEDTLSDPREGPAAAAAKAEDLPRVRAMLEGLGGRKALVLRLRFGLSGEGPLTLKDVGARLGLTPEGARQIEKGALTALARKLGRPGEN
jgi:RNA polymerase primary sigma factor